MNRNASHQHTVRDGECRFGTVVNNLPARLEAVPEAGIPEVNFPWEQFIQDRMPNVVAACDTTADTLYPLSSSYFVKHGSFPAFLSLLKSCVREKGSNQKGTKEQRGGGSTLPTSCELEAVFSKVASLYESEVAQTPYDVVDTGVDLTEVQHASQSFVIMCFLTNVFSCPEEHRLWAARLCCSALFHDIGRLILPHDRREEGHRTHTVNAKHVLSLCGPEVYRIGLFHGLAKALLCRVNKQYCVTFLSFESQDSLSAQGVWEQYTSEVYTTETAKMSQTNLADHLMTIMLARLLTDEGAKYVATKEKVEEKEKEEKEQEAVFFVKAPDVKELLTVLHQLHVCDLDLEAVSIDKSVSNALNEYSKCMTEVMGKGT